MNKIIGVCWVIFLSSMHGVFSDQIVKNQKGKEVCIQVAKTAADIDQEASRQVLIASFMHAYEDVPLVVLSPQFRSTGDVRRFYHSYFEEEFDHFREGHLIWVQAFIAGELAGWATFELEGDQHKSAYMNLLAVAPSYQHQGVGTALTFSICSEELFPSVKQINLLIRKVNNAGFLFYQSIGFRASNYQRGNFVDPALLTGLTWSAQELYGNN